MFATNYSTFKQTQKLTNRQFSKCRPVFLATCLTHELGGRKFIFFSKGGLAMVA